MHVKISYNEGILTYGNLKNLNTPGPKLNEQWCVLSCNYISYLYITDIYVIYENVSPTFGMQSS